MGFYHFVPFFVIWLLPLIYLTSLGPLSELFLTSSTAQVFLHSTYGYLIPSISWLLCSVYGCSQIPGATSEKIVDIAAAIDGSGGTSFDYSGHVPTALCDDEPEQLSWMKIWFGQMLVGHLLAHRPEQFIMAEEYSE